MINVTRVSSDIKALYKSVIIIIIISIIITSSIQISKTFTNWGIFWYRDTIQFSTNYKSTTTKI